MSSKTIPVLEQIHDENLRIAAEIRGDLLAKGLYCVNLMGAPGAGKTSCLIRLIQGLDPAKSYVIEGDIQSDIDTQKLLALGMDAVQIQTHGACHLDARLIQSTLAQMNLPEPGYLFIENIGNLVCPAEFDIGEQAKILVSTVTEGADKPYKYPLAFEKAKAILLNKGDLLARVEFDVEYFTRGVRALNPQAPIFLVSAEGNAGFDEVCQWLRDQR